MIFTCAVGPPFPLCTPCTPPKFAQRRSWLSWTQPLASMRVNGSSCFGHYIYLLEAFELAYTLFCKDNALEVQLANGQPPDSKSTLTSASTSSKLHPAFLLPLTFEMYQQCMASSSDRCCQHNGLIFLMYIGRTGKSYSKESALYNIVKRQGGGQHNNWDPQASTYAIFIHAF